MLLLLNAEHWDHLILMYAFSMKSIWTFCSSSLYDFALIVLLFRARLIFLMDELIGIWPCVLSSRFVFVYGNPISFTFFTELCIKKILKTPYDYVTQTGTGNIFKSSIWLQLNLVWERKENASIYTVATLEYRYKVNASILEHRIWICHGVTQTGQRFICNSSLSTQLSTWIV